MFEIDSYYYLMILNKYIFILVKVNCNVQHAYSTQYVLIINVNFIIFENY